MDQEQVNFGLELGFGPLLVVLGIVICSAESFRPLLIHIMIITWVDLWVWSESQ